ncbi:DUF2637 domain-containing protein [Protofrankia symbiont of Coriaria ruscifolia]|uniref:DUF2637 domain-containing protein n=1 Tax=Protofrankia symbiont of Coriaria ruscifolia TaxID=1306542 RepID=UPI001A93CDBA|nr:DUF2637 domain-containing protein [Protofrankia symbiont of Coriaria ruscifolia]
MASRRDWWVILGMTVTALSAAVSSFSGLRSLAAATGWPEVLTPLFPLTVDAYAMTATRVWLSGSTGSVRARRFARWNAGLAIGLSLVGNAVWHLIAAHVLTVTWVTIVLVGAVPPAVLGLLSHLAVLRGEADEDEGTSAGTELYEHQDEADADADKDELLEAARAAADAHRAEHGKPITRDQLRKRLHVSSDRASQILRTLRNSRYESDNP